MKRLLLTAALLAAGLVPPAGAQQQGHQDPAAQQQQQGQQATAASGTEVTGVVTSVDEEAHEIVIDGQTYAMPEQGGTAMLPAEGDRVTLFYREEGGQKVITRIGQPQQ